MNSHECERFVRQWRQVDRSSREMGEHGAEMASMHYVHA